MLADIFGMDGVIVVAIVGVILFGMEQQVELVRVAVLHDAFTGIA